LLGATSVGSSHASAVWCDQTGPEKASPLSTDLAFPLLRALSPLKHEERITAPHENLCLSSQAKLGDKTAITLYILSTQIVEKSPTLSDQQQQATTTVVVMLVAAKMICEVVDSL
jgi:hypothetical protein